MWDLSVTFDPLTGVKIASHIDAMVRALFGDKVPDGCPTDPLEKQRYLAAQAVAEFSIPVDTADIHASWSTTVWCSTRQVNSTSHRPRQAHPRVQHPPHQNPQQRLDP